jgi:hypothetical protein
VLMPLLMHYFMFSESFCIQEKTSLNITWGPCEATLMNILTAEYKAFA